MMSQTCPNCGTLNLDTYRFCSNCGAAIRPAEAAQPGTESAAPGAMAPVAPTNNIAQPSEGFAPPPPPPAPEMFGAETSAIVAQPGDQPAYIVKTLPEAENLSAQSAVPPSGGFIPPAPGGTPTQQIPATQAQPPQYGSYQAFNAGDAGAKDGGVYTPYPAAPVAALEKPKENRSWLVPVIVVAALLLVGLVAIGLYATQNNNITAGNDGNNSAGQATSTQVAGQSTAPASTSLPANASDEEKIKEVIRLSNEQQIKAWIALNPDLLEEYYTGKALADNVEMVNKLSSSQMRAVPVNNKLEILDVTVEDDGKSATAHTREVWTVTYTRNGKEEIQGPDTLEETYFLVKKDGKWYVNDLIIPQPAAPTPTVSGT